MTQIRSSWVDSLLSSSGLIGMTVYRVGAWECVRGCPGLQCETSTGSLTLFACLPACHVLPAIQQRPHAPEYLEPDTLPVSGLSMPENALKHIIKREWECLTTWPWISKYSAKWGGSMTFRSIESVLESVHRSVLDSILKAYFEGYNQVVWDCVTECNWMWPWEHCQDCIWEWTQRCTCKHTQSVFASVLKAYSRQLSEEDWECVIKCNWEYNVECAQEWAWVQLESLLGSIQLSRWE